VAGRREPAEEFAQRPPPEQAVSNWRRPHGKLREVCRGRFLPPSFGPCLFAITVDPPFNCRLDRRSFPRPLNQPPSTANEILFLPEIGPAQVRERGKQARLALANWIPGLETTLAQLSLLECRTIEVMEWRDGTVQTRRLGELSATERTGH